MSFEMSFSSSMSFVDEFGRQLLLLHPHHAVPLLPHLCAHHVATQCASLSTSHDELQSTWSFQNLGEIDPLGRVLHHPAVNTLSPVIAGRKRLVGPEVTSVYRLLELCEGRLSDLMKGSSIFPLPHYHDPLHYLSLDHGVYVGLINVAMLVNTPWRKVHGLHMATISKKSHKQKVAHLFIRFSNFASSKKQSLVPGVWVISHKRTENHPI
eukprot:TRINITY_DN1457_c0_g1_i2.p1 TRINITY_DN1457_c0_g1~~TRINITY_DN1457_c0_g1_i2.p1  ORF type:complete len:210 (+),score=33.99 TRINITY_DN1457_c0_g1_i2:71-700(+)